MSRFIAVTDGNRTGFGKPDEYEFGYAYAVRCGERVFVGGMTGTDLEGRVLADSAPEQLRIAYEKIGVVLEAQGASLDDVVSETMYCLEFTPELAQAHRDVMGGLRPNLTAVAVPSLWEPEMKVEVEVLAVIGNRDEKEQAS